MGKKRLVLFLLGVVAVMLLGMYFVNDVAASIENVTSSELTLGEAETQVVAAAGSINAQGENITEVNISQERQSDWWQGIWGNVKINLTLEDASGDVFYNWGDVNSSGEVYFSNDTVTSWVLSNMSDFNVTYAQRVFGWANSSYSDKLNETYQDTNGHEAFNAGGALITVGDTSAANMPSGLNCTMLMRNATETPVWAAIVSQQTTLFNGNTGDYECLLPVKSQQGTETFYVYAELE